MGQYGKYQNFSEMVPYIMSIILVLVLAFIGYNAPGTQEHLAQAPPYTSLGMLFMILMVWLVNKIGERQKLTRSE